jgi:AraC family transcriptional regulator, regulatory protein of adaptative response / methylated-DNA-[protein]-cysteine methyltransferase
MDASGITLAYVQTPIRPLLAGATHDAICLLEFTEQPRLDAQLNAIQKRFRTPVAEGRHPLLDILQVQLDEYFAGERRTFDIPLSYPGTPFQQNVWSALLKIPYGETCSYLTLAQRVGSPQAVRAVGQANGMNPIAIVIPCHRVVNTSGALGGYGGGLWRKQHLLDLERGDVLL